LCHLGRKQDAIICFDKVLGLALDYPPAREASRKRACAAVGVRAGTADEVTKRIVDAAQSAGANTARG
jgi:hypothetical protein